MENVEKTLKLKEDDQIGLSREPKKFIVNLVDFETLITNLKFFFQSYVANKSYRGRKFTCEKNSKWAERIKTT